MNNIKNRVESINKQVEILILLSQRKGIRDNLYLDSKVIEKLQSVLDLLNGYENDLLRLKDQNV